MPMSPTDQDFNSHFDANGNPIGPVGLAQSGSADLRSAVDPAFAQWQAAQQMRAAAGNTNQMEDRQFGPIMGTLNNNANMNLSPNVAYNLNGGPGGANQNRGQILDALAMMQQQQAGPSVVGLQGQMGQAAHARAAMAAMANGGMRGGNAVAGQALAGSGQMAGDVAQARLQEYMAGQQRLAAGYTGLRGADLQNFGEQSKIGLANNQMAHTRQMQAATMAAELNRAKQQAMIEQYKLYRQQGLANQQRGQTMLKGGAQAVGTVAAM